MEEFFEFLFIFVVVIALVVLFIIAILWLLGLVDCDFECELDKYEEQLEVCLARELFTTEECEAIVRENIFGNDDSDGDSTIILPLPR
jgi:hypothetical protein